MREFFHCLPRVVAALGVLVFALLADSAAADSSKGGLELYSATVSYSQAQTLVHQGLDLTEAQPVPGGVRVDLVLSPGQHSDLADLGIALPLWRNEAGKTANQVAAAQQQAGFKVWRSYDQAGGIRDEITKIAADHPDIVKLEEIGRSIQNRPILALKVTKDAAKVPDGSRPAVFYNAMQHAREWIAVEVNRRLLHHFVDNYGTDPEATMLVNERELWFVLVANPDGYQYTFDKVRLWRKNMHDNNGDGQITVGDGVDPNRNYPEHWNYDNEGSNSSPDSEVYRGTAAASEPETQAIVGLLGRVKFKALVNYHSAAQLLLYGLGWQVETYAADNPVSEALAGTPERSAVSDSIPEVSARLYTTNGETCDYAYSIAHTLCFTPELAGNGGGFVFPDDEAQVQHEFEKNRPFALDVARSAADMARPVSHLGNTVRPFYIDPFPVSYGDPQPVQVNAARYLGAVTMHYRINNGRVESMPTTEWAGGKRYGKVGSEFYHRMRGQVIGVRPGDQVMVWFEAGGQLSEMFRYTLRSDTGHRVLVLAAEDYAGSVPTYAKTDGPSYLQYYLDALAANGMDADVYDVDANARMAPSVLGVLGHYDAVIWYTGDDIVTRDVGMPAATASRTASDLVIAVREYLNEGGRLLYTGKFAGYQYTRGLLYDPVNNAPCGFGSTASCMGLSDDFMQYYLGAGMYLTDVEDIEEATNEAGPGAGWWSRAADNLDQRVSRTFNLSAAVAPITFSFDSKWSTEVDYDYGYVEVSTDGGANWKSIADMDGVLTDSDPNGANLGWGLNADGKGRLRFDLSTYAGKSVGLRLRYVADGGVVGPGWWVDNLSLVAAGKNLYVDNLDGGFGEWKSEGWIATPYKPVIDQKAFPILGSAPPLANLDAVPGSPSAGNQNHGGTFVPTSRQLPAAQYPQFTSWNAARFDRPADKPHSGSHHVYSDSPGNGDYHRLSRKIDLTGKTAGRLSFWVSQRLLPPWDTVFVEVHTVGQDDWTTLPDLNGHTAPDTGLNCLQGFWYNRHPRLQNYMSVDTTDPKRSVCQPKGTTGSWNAATGTSKGWEHWSVDLSAFGGRQVEVAIVVYGWSQALGVFVDDVTVSTGGADSSTSFETGLGDWTVTGAPTGSPANATDFAWQSAADFPAGAAVVTGDTVLLGFGIEGVAGAEARRGLMGRVMGYLLRTGRGEGGAVYLPYAQR